VHEAVQNDGAGRVAAQVSPTDTVVGGGGPLNGATARIEGGEAGGVSRLLSLGYDARGQLKSMAYHDPATSGAVPTPDGWELNGSPVAPSASRWFDWDASGRLRSVEVDDGSGPKQTAEFLYDSSGARILERVTPDGVGGEAWRVRRFAGLLRTTERPDGDDTTTGG